MEMEFKLRRDPSFTSEWVPIYSNSSPLPEATWYNSLPFDPVQQSPLDIWPIALEAEPEMSPLNRLPAAQSRWQAV